MGCLGNVLWFVFGGAVSGLSWCLAGCLWCITVVGIPVGMQCFKFAALSFFPFGKEVQYGGGAGSVSYTHLSYEIQDSSSACSVSSVVNSSSVKISVNSPQ